MAGLSIGALARRTGVHIETIRYFEKVGMLAAPERTHGGHRIYADQHVRALSFIKRARELGFTPAEVRAILNLGGPGRACCDEVQAGEEQDGRPRAAGGPAGVHGGTLLRRPCA